MKAYIIYIILHIIVLLTSININAVSVAFPDIMAEYDTTIVLAGWVLSIYQLVAVVAAVLVGKISDFLGLKKTFLICSLLFTIGSFLSAIAPNIYLLIFFRLIQSIGGGGLIPAVTGLIAEIFPDSRQRAIGLSMSIFTIGGVIGPSIGGALVTAWGWRSIFWVNVPFGILGCILVAVLLKAGVGKRGKIDYKGAAFLTGAVFSIMTALSQMGEGNSASDWIVPVVLLAAGAVFLVMFIKQEQRAEEPIVEMRLINFKPFAQANILNFVVGMFVFGFTSFLPLFAVTIHQLSVLQSSVMLSIRSIGLILATISASFLINKWGYRKPMLIGMCVNALFTMLVAVDPARLGLTGNTTGSIIFLSAVTFVAGAGFGVIAFCSINATIDLLPDKIALISGVRGMFMQFGGALSIAIISLVLEYLVGGSFGYELVYWAMGLIGMASLPLIFYLPERPHSNIKTDK